MKRYIKPEMKEHIPVTPFICQGVTTSVPDKPWEEIDPITSKYRGASSMYDDNEFESGYNMERGFTEHWK